mgnify:FL=1|jgi:hypothetical protein
MRLYLAETLVPRYARHALGVETAVDWSTAWRPGMENRQILSGSGGTRLIRGKFTQIVHEVRPVNDVSVSLWSDAKARGRAMRSEETKRGHGRLISSIGFQPASPSLKQHCTDATLIAAQCLMARTGYATRTVRSALKAYL